MPFASKSGIYIVIALLALSCNDDFIFTGEADEKKIVAVFFGHADSAIQMELYESQFITEDTLALPIPNAEIRLYLDGQFSESLSSNGLGNAKTQYKVNAGDSLRIAVRKDGYNLAETKALVPDQVDLIHFDTTTRVGSQLGLRLSFDDPQSKKNFYLMEMHAQRWIYELDQFTQERIDSTKVWESIDIQSVNKIFFSDKNIVTNEQKFELFNDQIFNGQKQYVLDINVNAFNLRETISKGEAKRIKVRLRNVNEDYYNFLTALSLNRPIFGGPFSISSQVPGNIAGGYGIFAVYTSSTAAIQMK